MDDRAKKILKITAAIVLPAGVGVAAYLIFFKKTKTGITLWQKWTKKEQVGNTASDTSSSSGKASSTTKSSSSVTPGFPLKFGDKNAYVKNMQQGLIKILGSSALPRYGADSDFGSETQAALTKAGYTAPVSQQDYNNIVNGLTAKAAAIFDFKIPGVLPGM